ncbi:MAG: AAA family ATPase [Johnsonella sp.]|nr:AAA family ATPase [Johnsonella sp.]
MRLLELHINGFGKFKNTDIRFSEGVNIIYGYNETGKSTIHSFIRAMFYGMERGRGRARKHDIWSKYEPWEQGSAYGGMIKVLKGGEVFRIERDFLKSAALPLSVINETRGKAVEDNKAFLHELMCGLSEVSYTNTISIGQLKSATDSGMVNELKNHISNMNASGNIAINITKASDYLKARKKEYLGKIQPEAAKAYAANLSEIKLIENEISSPCYANNIKTLKEQKAEAAAAERGLLEQKEALIGEISGNKQLLDDNGFGSGKEIDDFREELQLAYEKYDALKPNAFETGMKALSVLLVLLCLLSIGFTFAFFFGNAKAISDNLSLIKHNTLTAIAFLLSIIFLIISVFMIRRGLGRKKEYALARAQLLDLFESSEEELESSIPELSTMNARLDELKTLADELDLAELRLVRINNELSSLNALQEEYSRDIEAQQKHQWELEKQIEQLSNLKDDNSALKQVISDNERFGLEISALEIAQDVMQNLSLTIRNSFGLYLNKEASILIKGITKGAYDSLSVDENLNVFMNTSKKLVPMEQVSSGTMDQIYLALRLASAKLLQGEGEPLPLIFDDSFVNYDESRLKATLEWLHQYYDRQILIFTCHTREEALLKESGIDFNIVKM